MGTWAPSQPGVWAPTLVSPRDVAQNVLLYVPFGALGVLSRLRAGGASARRAVERPWWRETIKVCLLAVLFSATVETLQLYTIDRVASLTDIVSATIGSAIGGGVVSVWRSPK
jgi:VanZ family protein